MFDRPSSQGDRVVLVQIFFPKDHEQDLDEFRELILSAGGKIVHEVIAKREFAEPKYLVGSGKANEIHTYVQQAQADLVIFSHELTPAQERNLEKLFSRLVPCS